ncbi:MULTISPECIES: glycosyltransferase family 2 protein [Streptomyces]|uniref:Glycosyltransferase n=1 Tax=Streptomyces dengpaensis TaxID=2049881 RepID=A0ABM6SQ47_9ACTN|nr:MULTISPECIES: glycosyltransferase family 2 protein [Streptomyces]AVH56804.1 glycosyltransferase [Streptomyces dengpaensis]PIB10167.1 glycosyltransferase [Streptomyces sp. HG99]
MIDVLHDPTDRIEYAVELSVVIPMFNEEEALPALVGRLRPVLDGTGEPYEVVAVDDGSTDRTAELLLELRATWPQLRMVRLRRNSGHQAALTAGLHHARGRYAASLDADLQDPPEKIPEMLVLARSRRLDIVYGVRANRSTDTGFKRRTAGAYYWLMRRLVGNHVPAQAGDFRLLSRNALDALKALPDQPQVYRLLVPWFGFPSGEVTYHRDERVAGQTKYPLRKMILLAVDSIISFSVAPLRLATWLGTLAFFVCLGTLVYTLAVYAAGDTTPGWASLIIAVLFIGAVQLICLGVLGEYIGRIYTVVQQRPTYYVAEDTGTATAPAMGVAWPGPRRGQGSRQDSVGG